MIAGLLCFLGGCCIYGGLPMKMRNGEIQERKPYMLIAGGILMGLGLLIWAITNK